MNQVPQLSYQQGDQFRNNRWVLSISGSGFEHDTSFRCEIDHSWDGETWDHFRFFEMDMGDQIELLTLAEFREMCDSICEHEGENAAREWCLTQTKFRTVEDNHPVFKMRAYWLSLMELGIINPSVTL